MRIVPFSTLYSARVSVSERSPAVAQESPFGDHEARRVTRGPDGLVRITLKKPFSDGTVAVDLDPLSLLSRLAASVPTPRLHTVRYAGVLASASKLRARLAPKPVVAPAKPHGGRGREPAPRRLSSVGAAQTDIWVRRADLPMLQRKDEAARTCHGSDERRRRASRSPKGEYLRGIGEPTDVPKRTPARGPPYWASRVLRRGAASVEAAE